MKPVFNAIGAKALGLLSYFGQLAMMAADIAFSLLSGKVRGGIVLSQIVTIGIGSQLVVMITGAFTGAVFATQAYFKFNELGMASATGPVVSIIMCRELGPVLAGLMVAGRTGAAMAAEIGTMRVTEQIDALRSMGVSPIDYLVVPRLVAVVISMPILVGEAIFFGMAAAEVMTVRFFGVPEIWFRMQTITHTGATDIATGLIKGTVFGGILVLISCHQGLNTGNGAVGVGRSTTRSVVYSSVAILISNLFLSVLLNRWLPSVTIDL